MFNSFSLVLLQTKLSKCSKNNLINILKSPQHINRDVLQPEDLRILNIVIQTIHFSNQMIHFLEQDDLLPQIAKSESPDA